MKLTPLRILLPGAAGIGLLAALLVWTITGLITPVDPTWQAIQARGVWLVGMDPSFPPFEFLDATGQPVGYDVDLAQALAEEMGVDVQIVALGFDGLIDALLNGKVDSVISALPFDPRLTEDVRYSQSYFEAGVRLVTRLESGITGVETLSGRTVAVEWGGAGDVHLRRLQREEPTIQRRAYETQTEALEALIQGEADAALVEGVTFALAQGRGMALQAVGPALESTPYVIAMPITATILAQQTNENLTKLQKSGFLLRLERRWFSRDGTP
ncbi:MAG: hypothetical protein D6790_19010 [Caldilineae bacterium]|nr:MAG: hypothetical protein D6790_19010 [Caldilineae bacterium]